MKEHCVDLELAKELKENGFPQNSIYYELFQKSLKVTENDDWFKEYKNQKCNKLIKVHIPSSDEILKELPNITKDGILKIYQMISCFEVRYSPYSSNCDSKMIKDKKLPNALAKMWLCLKKEGYIG